MPAKCAFHCNYPFQVFINTFPQGSPLMNLQSIPKSYLSILNLPHFGDMGIHSIVIIHFVVSLNYICWPEFPSMRHNFFLFFFFFFLLEKSEKIEDSEWGCYWGTDSRKKGIQKTHEYLCRSTQRMASYGHRSTAKTEL